jgi:hypothetical protein
VSQRRADEERFAIPAKEAVPIDAGSVVPGNVDLKAQERTGIATRRQGEGAGRRALPECFVRTLIVVLTAEEVEDSLLRRQGGARRLGGLRL